MRTNSITPPLSTFITRRQGENLEQPNTENIVEKRLPNWIMQSIPKKEEQQVWLVTPKKSRSNQKSDDEKQPNAGSQRANTVYLALEQRVERLGVINECLNCLSSIYATKYCNKKKRKRFHSKGPHSMHCAKSNTTMA
ncbi:hypothetical protein DINM_006140 [Dirofilaria immitis]|nr:hypothetical protein [Dirofilaria immitis]